MYDVIIVGAGPAGSTLARHIGTSLSVLLVDARPWDRTSGRFNKKKCCGGLLAPAAQKVLAGLGMEIPRHILQEAQPLSVEALDLASGHRRRYPRAYWNMDREAFEGWLLAMVPPSVTFCPGTRCLKMEKEQDGWRVVLQGSTMSEARGRMVVSADGASSIVRRTLGKPMQPHRRYLAVQYEYDCRETHIPSMMNTAYLAFFHPEVTDFYGWCIAKGDRLLVGAALPPASVSRLSAPKVMGILTTALHKQGFALPRPAYRHGCIVNRPTGKMGKDVFLGEHGAFCVGEAAGWISPSSAEGFSYAFRSGLALGDAMLKYKDEPEAVMAAYRRGTAPLLCNLAWKRCKSVVMFTPWLRRLVMCSGITAKE